MGRKIKLKGKIAEFVGEMLEMPSAPISDGYSVVVTDGREAYVTGCRAILSYDNDVITVETGKGMLILNGKDLDIKSYTDGEITVRGRITSVTLEEGEKC